MKINHLDLQVADVQATVLHFERLFGLTLESSRTSPAVAIMSDGEGFTLVLQRRNPEEAYPERFHFGFLVDDPERVRAFQSLAKSEGFDVSEVIENGRGTLSYLRMPDGLLVEVSNQRRRTHVPESTQEK